MYTSNIIVGNVYDVMEKEIQKELSDEEFEYFKWCMKNTNTRDLLINPGILATDGIQTNKMREPEMIPSKEWGYISTLENKEVVVRLVIRQSDMMLYFINPYILCDWGSLMRTAWQICNYTKWAIINMELFNADSTLKKVIT